MQQLIFYIVQYNGESAQISTKVKGLGQAFFPKGLRVSRGRSHIVAVAAVVNYVYLRNLFADGKCN